MVNEDKFDHSEGSFDGQFGSTIRCSVWKKNDKIPVFRIFDVTWLSKIRNQEICLYLA